MSNGSTTWSFTYDANGLRTQRTNGTTAYNYIYNGSQLAQMTVGGNTLRFTYDALGMPLTVNYNGTTYYYSTNVQGDIIAILDASGNSVVQYVYDAWGNVRSTAGSLASTLGAHNPLRYRGYVYDNETALYYLQFRYYNPETARFLNADAFAATGQGLTSNNMFAYCLNSPIIGIDSNGRRMYFINGINNDDEEDSPPYAYQFASKLKASGIENVKTIPVYNGQSGIIGTLIGISMVALEMVSYDVYTSFVVAWIEADLEEHPLEKGEQINLIGYSGGGQIALNVMETMGDRVDNVILIGAPVLKKIETSTEIFSIYAGLDPLSWSIGLGYTSYFAGWIGHTDYFNAQNIDNTARIVKQLIR